MARIVIFGVQDTAELAWHYLTTDSEHEVVAFTVDHDYLPQDLKFCGLPVVPLDQLTTYYPSSDHYCFIAMTGEGMNTPRRTKFEQLGQMGYDFISYISSRATVLSDDIGVNCFILENNTIQPFSSIGDNVVLWSGNHIGHHSKIEDHVCVTSHVVISGHCHIGEQSFLGVNSTIRDGVTLAKGSLISMSTCITKSTEAWKCYVGNPARALSGSSKSRKIYHEMEA